MHTYQYLVISQCGYIRTTFYAKYSFKGYFNPIVFLRQIKEKSVELMKSYYPESDVDVLHVVLAGVYIITKEKVLDIPQELLHGYECSFWDKN